MKAKDKRIAERLKARGWQVSAPVVPCPPHGPHPHGGLTCLDCEVCRPPHAEGGHDA